MGMIDVQSLKEESGHSCECPVADASEYTDSTLSYLSMVKGPDQGLERSTTVLHAAVHATTLTTTYAGFVLQPSCNHHASIPG